MIFKQLPWRESDQKIFVSENVKIVEYTKWKPKVNVEDGLIKMVEWLNINQ
jgi:CDP-paratose 2-epimerase